MEKQAWSRLYFTDLATLKNNEAASLKQQSQTVKNTQLVSRINVMKVTVSSSLNAQVRL